LQAGGNDNSVLLIILPTEFHIEPEKEKKSVLENVFALIYFFSFQKSIGHTNEFVQAILFNILSGFKTILI